VAACGLLALVTTRYASILTTTIAASSVILLAGSAALGYTAYEYVLGAALILLVIAYALRQNYARIRQGTERKVGRPKPDKPAVT
jgi:glycerol-3-phosphate acyltransferase PlsY